MGRIGEDEDHTFEETVTGSFTWGGLTVEEPVVRSGALPLPERYQDLGVLGFGAMGEVRQVRDRLLDAVVAMKVIRPQAGSVRAVRARFEAEARLTAKLRHPNIVGVFDTGVLDDGRVWFTMEIVEGETLETLIRSLHEARGRYAWRATAEGWTLRKLVRVLLGVCDAVALAHSMGVVHRDLKPANIMVGEHGDVKVMDWGIARFGKLDLAGDPASVEAFPSEHRTAVGKVIGTPVYMAPEQARGERDKLGPPCDVYALGIILYELLVGRAPHAGTGDQVLIHAQTGTFTPLGTVFRDTPQLLPSGLEAIVNAACQREIEDRPAHAGVLAQMIRDWLATDERREQARVIFQEAEALLARLPRLQSEAEALDNAARATLAVLEPSAPVAAKSPGWQLEALALEKRRELAETRAEAEEVLWSALAFDPGYDRARDALAELQAQALARAEQVHDTAEIEARLTVLRSLQSPRHTHLLQEVGALTLVTDPPGAHVRLMRFEERDRVLHPVFERDLGTTPLQEVELPAGSWLLELHLEGHEVVRYPVLIERGGHWDGIPPEGRAGLAIPLPPNGTLGPGEVYVPPGWYVAGGQAPHAHPRRRVWVDGFVIERLPLLVRDVVSYWREAEGGGEPGPDLAAVRVPQGPVILSGSTPTDNPVALMAVAQALSIGLADRVVRWRSERDGKDWRLPDQHEWEKACRGVDGRPWPWGWRFAPSLAHVVGSEPEPTMRPAGSFPTDASVYGVAELVGGQVELTASAWSSPAPPDGSRVRPEVALPGVARVQRGGSIALRPPWNRAAVRHRLPADAAKPTIRLVRSWPGGAP